MAKNRLSAMQIKELYRLTTHGDSLYDASRSLGIEYGTAATAIRILKQYIAFVLDGEKRTETSKIKRVATPYLHAARWAVKNDAISRKKPEPVAVEDPVETPKEEMTISPAPVETDDHYARLNVSFGVFTDAIYSFIDREIERRYGDLKKENEDMKRLIDEARVGNFADALKKHWEGK